MSTSSSGQGPEPGADIPPWVRRQQALRAMTKHARETDAYKHRQGRRKRARMDGGDGRSTPPTSQTARSPTPGPPDYHPGMDDDFPTRPPTPPPSQGHLRDPPSRPPTPPSSRGHSHDPPSRPPTPPSSRDHLHDPPSRPPTPPATPDPSSTGLGDRPLPPPNYRCINIPRRPVININLEQLAATARLSHLKECMEYVLALRNASLDDPVASLDGDALHRIRTPRTSPLEVTAPGIRHSITSYLGCEHAAQHVYETFRRSHNALFSDHYMLSHSEVEKTIAEYTGVDKIQHDMCPNTCIAYTGPLQDLDECPKCHTSRWNQEKLHASNGRTKVAARKFTTIPLGPQLQARYRHPVSAKDMKYLYERAQQILAKLKATGEIPVYDDVAMGLDFLSAVIDEHIKPNDIVVMLSIDGAQLYQSKASDCWIYIWVVLNLSPDKRYKKVNVLPGGFIPGPNKPQNVDSFLFPGLHHVSALQREGLLVWDSSEDIMFRSDIYVLYETADGPGLVYWDGLVGHCGKNGCRLYCGVRGRKKTDQSRYYAALLKPTTACQGSDHADIRSTNLPSGGAAEYSTNLHIVVASTTNQQYAHHKTDTGLSRPPMILGLQPCRSLGIPYSITTDIMHLVANLSALLLSLWRATIKCDPTDDKSTWDWAVLANTDAWTEHGKRVALAGQYLPGSFDRKPRNIAEKINTQYKTWEHQLHTFALAPALLFDVLPRKYWQNHCKLVRGIQIVCQHSITTRELQHAHGLLCSWEREFETLYYQRREDRLHFIYPCIHQVLHLVPETFLKGPPICYAQWTMERTIGNLGQEIRQPSNPFENLSQEGVRRSQVNALLAVIPEIAKPSLRPSPSQSSLAEDIGDNYFLLRKRERRPSKPIGKDADAIQSFLAPLGSRLHPVQKWARLQLPNGQIARSLWRECLIPPLKLRVSRNIKFSQDNETMFGEVQYFTRLSVPISHDIQQGRRWLEVAIVKPYSQPDQDLLFDSSQAIASCRLLDDIAIVDVKRIHSVVAMVPHTRTLLSGLTEGFFFVVEKPGLDLSDLGVPYPQYEEYEFDDNDTSDDVE